MKKVLVSVMTASIALSSLTMAQGNQSQYKYSYKYQQKQESQARNQYRNQYQYGNAYQGTNPNMGNMGSMSQGMRMGSMGGGGRH